MAEDKPSNVRRQRVHIFVDFWNYDLSMHRIDVKFRTDYKALAQSLVRAAGQLIEPGSPFEYAGMNVYMSSDDSSDAEAGLRKWATQVLDRFPGTQVSMVSRQRKVTGPKCPSCKGVVTNCPTCTADMRGTEEKGVDVRIATDMIMLAWVDSYDVAVLVSSDSDFVPVVQFLQTKGKKVVHAQFPPRGAFLSQKCWGSIDVPKLREEYRLAAKAPPNNVTPLVIKKAEPNSQ